MRQLWAPWRIEYILSEKGDRCLFCDVHAEDRDRDNLILYRDRNAYIIMNRYPYNSGHLMVVPYFHTSSFDGLSEEVLSEMTMLTKLSIKCLAESMRPEGFNTGINIGNAAGAGIEEHLHIHVVPRWVGDSSFMAVLDEVRVVPEHLMETYDKLYNIFNKKRAVNKGEK
jgi:ATP adenylyltransferase